MGSILDEIVRTTRLRVARAKERCPLATMSEHAFSKCGQPPAADFKQALKKPGISFICEVKRASPSKGIIAHDFPYLAIAKAYEAAGAAAISVLTEPDYFMGANEYLAEIAAAVTIPTLRKDFIIDEYQIFEAKQLNASAILLICSLFDTNTLASYIQKAKTLGLDALVEVHNKAELETALEAGAAIIGVNNRDLVTFQVDLQNSLRLRSLVPDHIPFVAESGIHSRDDVKRLAGAGVDAVLIGEAMMKAPDKAAYLAELWPSV